MYLRYPLIYNCKCSAFCLKMVQLMHYASCRLLSLKCGVCIKQAHVSHNLLGSRLQLKTTCTVFKCELTLTTCSGHANLMYDYSVFKTIEQYVFCRAVLLFATKHHNSPC